jgi:hypothetical protein
MMAKEKKESVQSPLKYRRVQIAGLTRNRRGKHHDLISGICRELELLPHGAALAVPLTDAGGLGIAKLRSAIHRGTASRDISIETLADKENLYVWRKNASR